MDNSYYEASTVYGESNYPLRDPDDELALPTERGIDYAFAYLYEMMGMGEWEDNL